MAWNDNCICLLHYIWVSIHHMIRFFCYTSLKWWHLQMLFSFFSKVWFSELLGFLGGVKQPKMRKNSLILYLGNCTLYDCVFWNTCKMMISPAIFSLFSKVWFFGFFKVHQWMAKGNFESIYITQKR